MKVNLYEIETDLNDMECDPGDGENDPWGVDYYPNQVYDRRRETIFVS